LSELTFQVATLTRDTVVAAELARRASLPLRASSAPRSGRFELDDQLVAQRRGVLGTSALEQQRRQQRAGAGDRGQDVEGLAASSGYLLARLGVAFKAQATARAEESGFELYDYSVLAILGEGSRETQATIAEALSVDPSRLVALLDSLEERELIVRQRDPQDRRRHVVSITEAGAGELTRLRTIVRRLEDEFFAPLDAESRAALHPMLVALAAQNDPRCCPMDDFD
jgi:DNA-binding MarR family transcriptional regulator